MPEDTFSLGEAHIFGFTVSVWGLPYPLHVKGKTISERCQIVNELHNENELLVALSVKGAQISSVTWIVRFVADQDRYVRGSEQNIYQF